MINIETQLERAKMSLAHATVEYERTDDEEIYDEMLTYMQIIRLLKEKRIISKVLEICTGKNKFTFKEVDVTATYLSNEEGEFTYDEEDDDYELTYSRLPVPNGFTYLFEKFVKARSPGILLEFRTYLEDLDQKLEKQYNKLCNSYIRRKLGG